MSASPACLGFSYSEKLWNDTQLWSFIITILIKWLQELEQQQTLLVEVLTLYSSNVFFLPICSLVLTSVLASNTNYSVAFITTSEPLQAALQQPLLKFVLTTLPSSVVHWCRFKSTTGVSGTARWSPFKSIKKHLKAAQVAAVAQRIGPHLKGSAGVELHPSWLPTRFPILLPNWHILPTLVPCVSSFVSWPGSVSTLLTLVWIFTTALCVFMLIFKWHW